jgi:hypothetical protein
VGVVVGFIGLACAVALAVVLAVSGVAKLLDGAGTREAVLGFGVPSRLVPYVAGGLAPAELVTAVLLLLPGARVVGLVLAVLLLLAFTVAVVLALRAGRRPECHCFGRIGGADVSARTVARNLGLLVVAAGGLVGAIGGVEPDGAAAVGAVVTGLALASAILAAEGLAGAAARRRRDIEDDTAYAQGGSGAAPRFEAVTLDGRTSLDRLLAPGLPVMLVSLSPGCGPCKSLRPDVASWARIFRDRLTFAVLATGTAEANRPSYAEAPHLTVIVDEGDVRTELGISATPSAVVIAPDGSYASGVAHGERLVRQLLVSTVTGVEPPNDVLPESDSTEGPAADDLVLTSVVGPRDGVQQHELGESTVLLNPATGATVALDTTGSLVWSVLDGSSRLEEIVTDLADVFGVPREVVGPDVLELVRSLGRAGLLDGVAADRSTRPPAPGEQEHDHDHPAGAGHDHDGLDGAGTEDDVEAGRPV